MDQLDIDPALENLLQYLKHSRGIDFTGYKRSSLMRRVNKRIETVGIESYIEYQDYLELHPEEFVHLFNGLLINVTGFFRDRSAWDYIVSNVVPKMIAEKDGGENFRLWSAGCASGEEAYTLAIIMAEAVGFEQFRERVKIFATDIDEEALNQARLGTYCHKEVTGLPKEYLKKYFELIDNRYAFRKDLRRSIIFGRNNLVQDAPISRIDLLTCRNTIMYFNAETQAKILTRFHFALNDGGILFLGKAETLLTHNHSFAPVDLKRRIFTQVQKGNLRDRLLLLPQAETPDTLDFRSNLVRMRETAFDAGTSAQVVVDTSGSVVLANERARNLFDLKAKDIGRPLQDLEVSYRPVELRSRIAQVYSECRAIVLKDIEWLQPNSVMHYLDVEITPLSSATGVLLGTSISFSDVSRTKQLQEELQQANQELEMAYEEVQSTNEELETTNEELQSTVEELETTNEELQSTNEELETINEELQSTNEELQTINDELRYRTDELNQANGFLECILTSLRSGVVVVNRDLLIQIWNNKAEDLWGMRSDEVHNEHFLNLDIGLPVGQLRQSIRDCLNAESQMSEIILDATNRRGRMMQCKIVCTPLLNWQKKVDGAILLMDEVVRQEPVQQ
ncbi:CheR family methyltransferase [Microcoleus sp. FACHB-672]|uniref:CheR family methyltransferase n=1 Tax=Microcoleus sp. FACHB-672 TaxID=2692825 RepID=UPI001686F16E|nr:CheR family methyltransferase [Microcoleus sp. FACHB-672]MBD2041941.1 PAS domain-containing protein [Microcoleus sp. FACHB-672]